MEQLIYLIIKAIIDASSKSSSRKPPPVPPRPVDPAAQQALAQRRSWLQQRQATPRRPAPPRLPLPPRAMPVPPTQQVKTSWKDDEIVVTTKPALAPGLSGVLGLS